MWFLPLPAQALALTWPCGEPVELFKKWKIILCYLSPTLSLPNLLRLIPSWYNEVNKPAKEPNEGHSHSKGNGGWVWDQNKVESRLAHAAAQTGKLLFAIFEPCFCSAPPLNCSPVSPEGAFDDQLLIIVNLLSVYLSSVPKPDEVITVWTGKNVPTWARPEAGDSYL